MPRADAPRKGVVICGVVMRAQAVAGTHDSDSAEEEGTEGNDKELLLVELLGIA